MPENESLDISHSPRWTRLSDAVCGGEPCERITALLERALIGALRKVQKEFRESGASLAAFLDNLNSAQVLRQLIRQTQGHDYARLFVAAAAVNVSSRTDCLRAWIGAILDTVADGCTHRSAGSPSCPTIDDAQARIHEAREALAPVVERLVERLAENPDCQLRRTPRRGPVSADPTAELLNMSLIGARG